MEHSLVYMSKADPLVSNKELQRILKESIQWNTDHGITGMLIYVEGLFASLEERSINSSVTGRFMQVLEGSKKEVEDIFSKIKLDKRHTDIVVLQREDKKFRDFENWWMGFQSFTLEEYSTLPGFFNLDSSFIDFAAEQSENRPLQFLKSFYQRGLQEDSIFGNKNDQ